MKTSLLYIGLIVLAGSLAACSPGVGDVSGGVTFQGQSLPSGRVIIFCQSGNKETFNTEIHNGAYSFQNIPAGQVVMTVESRPMPFLPISEKLLDDHLQGNLDRPLTPPPGISLEKLPEMLKIPPGTFIEIPERYKSPETSGLTFTINRGTQNIDISLTP